jgi:hypothetical protein
VSFAAAAFLAGLLALALPWWLHRRETVSGRQRVISSLLLIRASPAPERRHKTLRHRALLALRLALLAVLAIAFAQPLLDAAPGPEAAQRAPPRLVVLDTSMSMATSFTAARARARALLDEMPAGTPGAVITAGADIRLAAPLTGDRATLLAAVDAAAPQAVRLGFDGLLGRVSALARTLTEAPVEIHLISDFQASAMASRFNALVDGVNAVTVLHDVATPGPNWHVAGIVAGEPSAGRSRAAVAAGSSAPGVATGWNERPGKTVRVTVGSFADAARTLTVMLSDVSGELDRRTVSVPAGGQATVAFAGAAGGGWLRAAIDADDTIALDDVAYFAPPPLRDADLPVFAAPAAARQADYLAAAVAASSPGFRLAGPEAEGPVAVLLDPGALAEDRLRLLQRHLDSGGAVLATAGPATSRAGRLPLAELPLTSQRLERSVTGVAAVDASHPALRRFGAWQTVSVFRHLAPAGEVEVLAALDDGTPLLIERRVGAGLMLALLTALDPEWSTLVVEPAFVTFVADALAYLAEDHLPGAATAGEPLSLPAASVQILDLQGRRKLGLNDTVGRPTVRLDEPGIYTVRTPNRQRQLAVNADSRESNPTPAAAALLNRWRQALPAAARADSAPVDAAVSQSVALAPWLLLALLVLAVGEPLAANLVRREAVA